MMTRKGKTTGAGLYVWYTREDAIRYMRDNISYRAWTCPSEKEVVFKRFVVAKVRLSGMVLKHANLMLAESLEIVEIHAPVNANNRRALAHKMGWPFKIQPITKEEIECALQANSMASSSQRARIRRSERMIKSYTMRPYRQRRESYAKTKRRRQAFQRRLEWVLSRKRSSFGRG